MSKLAAPVLAACAALLSVGCADNQETLIVTHAPLWPDDGSCAVDPSNDDALLFGSLDLQFDTPYLMPAILFNNTPAQAANDNNTGVSSNEIQLIDADVVIDSLQAPQVIDMIDDALLSFTVSLSTNSIPPSESIGVAVEVLPLGTVQALREQMQAQLEVGAKIVVRANVVFNGTRSNNDVGGVGRVKARDFSFPIQLCVGCLYTCAGCTGGECPAQVSSYAGGVCGNAQDLPIWPAPCEAP